MKKFRTIKLAAALTAVLMTAVSAEAAVIDKAVYNTNTDTITVSGNMQEVDRTLLSENLLSDGSCDEIGNWKIRGGTETNSPNAALSVEENSYLKLTNRELYYTGIRHSVYDILNTYGFGTYRISGKVKAENKTLDDGTVIEYGDVKVIVMTQGDQYILTVKKVSDEWMEFTGDITISTYGYSGSGDSKVENTAWPKGEGVCIIYAETYNGLDASGTTLKDTNNATVRDTRDLCIDDFSIQYVGQREIYEGAESARITVTNPEGTVVYANEVTADADGNYSISLQLPDSADRNAVYVANVSGENTQDVISKQIYPIDIRSRIRTENVDGMANIKFDIFDFFNTYGLAEIKAIAGSYTADGKLYKTEIKDVAIDLDTATTQEISVEIPTEAGSYTKLMLWNSIQGMKPLCKIHSDNNPEADLILVGDSITVAYRPEAEPQHGWGEYIGNYFSEKINVINCAHGGYSTATFMDPENFHAGYGYAHTWNSETIVTSEDGETKPATPILPLIGENDFVIVSLGINDMSSQKGRYTTEEEYKANLRKMATDTIAQGASILFVTPSTSAAATGGLYENRYAERAGWMKQVAEEVGANCLDLGKTLTDHYNEVGSDKVKYYHLFREVLLADISEGGYGMTEEQLANHTNAVLVGGGDDKVHLSDKGADMVAKTIADLLAETDDGLANYLAR